jgi:hypothetical protein
MFGYNLTFFEKVNFFVGEGDSWQLGIAFNHYDRAFIINILKWYVGVEVWHNE